MAYEILSRIQFTLCEKASISADLSTSIPSLPLFLGLADLICCDDASRTLPVPMCGRLDTREPSRANALLPFASTSLLQQPYSTYIRTNSMSGIVEAAKVSSPGAGTRMTQQGSATKTPPPTQLKDG